MAPIGQATETVDPLGRRAFVRGGLLWLAGSSLVSHDGLRAGTPGPDTPSALRIGLLTDVHYADRPASGSRHYRDSLDKIREAASRFREDKTRFAVELGDFIDAAPDVEQEIAHLKTVDREFATVGCERHYVLGNHCVYTLTKDEFLANSGAKKPFYSFDSAGFHFVVLDACFRGDGQPYGRQNFKWTDANVPDAELAWLEKDLQRSSGKRTVVFIHQRLDVADHYGVRNAAAVRDVLDRSGRVLAVFQGHNHINDYRQLGNIHYVTVTAMVEGPGTDNGAYALLDLFSNGSMRLDGFRRQHDHDLKQGKSDD